MPRDTALCCSLTLLLLASCQSPSKARVTHLPAFAKANTMDPVEGGPFFAYRNITRANLPLLVPFAIVTTSYHVDRGLASQTTWEHAKKMRADLLVCVDGAQHYAGSSGSSVYLGWGITTAFSTPIYRTALHGICYRLAPVSLGEGWELDDAGMVMTLSDEIRKCGIQEGDRLLSFDGARIRFKEEDQLKSPHLTRLLEHKPGDEVTLVWIRPGKGRMEGKITLKKNPAERLLEVEWEDPSLPGVRKGERYFDYKAGMWMTRK